MVTPREVCISGDVGDSWQGIGAREQFALPYCRTFAVKADDPNVILIGTGNTANGDMGAIQRSTDGGRTWQSPRLPMPAANSYISAFATNAADPDLILATSHHGQLYASPDGGEWWVKLPKETTEVRGALAWFPN